MTTSWRQEKNASAFFELPTMPLAIVASPAGETAVPEGKNGLEKSSKSSDEPLRYPEGFFDLKEGVTLLTATEYKKMIRKIGFQQSLFFFQEDFDGSLIRSGTSAPGL